MFRRYAAALLFPFLAAFSLHAQRPQLSLCIVQTKPDQATQYDPSAGPWSIALYNQLFREKLRNGAPLNPIVLAASIERDVLPEAVRLRCAWVAQLWYQQKPNWGADWDQRQRSLFFALRNPLTGKVIASGAAPVRDNEPWVTVLNDARDSNAIACSALAKQILERLNQLR
jgi:hypothetical protein